MQLLSTKHSGLWDQPDFEPPEVESKQAQIFCILQESHPNARNLPRGHFCGLDKPEAFTSSSDLSRLLPPAAGILNKILKARSFNNLPLSLGAWRESIWFVLTEPGSCLPVPGAQGLTAEKAKQGYPFIQ